MNNKLIPLVLCLAVLCAGCATMSWVPTRGLTFKSFPDSVVMPVVCQVVFPQVQPDFIIKDRFYDFKVIVGPLFTKSVPKAVERVVRTVTTEGTASKDFILEAEVTSLSSEGFIPVLKMVVKYKLNRPDGMPIAILESKQSYKKSLDTRRETPDRMIGGLILLCLEDLNAQIIQKRKDILNKHGN